MSENKIFVFFRFLLVASIVCFTLTPQTSYGKPPNVLLIISDDQGYFELGSFLADAKPENFQPQQKADLLKLLQSDDGAGVIDVTLRAAKNATPNLDQIASEGIRFTNFYAAPTCGPARAALLSARYPQTFGAYSNTELSDSSGVPPQVDFPVKAFAQAGYRTGIFGKWHLGDGNGQHPNDKGFDTYFGYDRAHTDKYNSPHLFRNRSATQAEGWLCDQVTNEALQFLDECEAEDKPFFLFLSLPEPKPPSPKPPAQYMEAIDSGSLVVDMHFGSIYGMDYNIGRIITQLTKMDAIDDTLILFASDNGLNNGVWREHPDYRKKNENDVGGHRPPWARVPTPGNGPLRGAKWSAWEGGVRTPMIARLPGGVSGESNALTSIIDFFPTALDYAGIQTEIPVDGESFLEVLEGSSTGDPGRMLFWAHLDAIPMATDGHPQLERVKNDFRSRARTQMDYFGGWYVRSGPWKLIGWNDYEPLLFNVLDDPGEHENLAEDFPEVVQMFRRQFLAWMEENPPPYVGQEEVWRKLLD
jgi:uncharacterized sulfatase